ncbi:cecropin-like peptide 1 [Hermetia illucens]|uniref:cecropin-like peptide 1 n=1 Tax=Hermetia illucens TaxID=343691 RepID=UPI0018CBF350|nr:cecropin-like peptide 1 [Hermetia illucens]
MQFSKLFVVFTILIVAFAGQSEASWWKKVFKPVEKLGQRVRDATIQGLGIAQQGANVLATVRGGPPQ